MTNLTTTEINAIAAEASGTAPTRSANKERAIAKLTAAMEAIVGKDNSAKAAAAILACANAAAATAAIRNIRAEAGAKVSPGLARLRANPKAEEVRQAVLADEKIVAAIPAAVSINDPAFAESPEAKANAASWDAIPAIRRARSKAALKLVEAAPKAEKPARAEKKAAKAAQPGKRAAILEAAQRGELPAAPDFSAETHKRFRAKLAQIVAAVEAGDIEALRAFTINPVSSSPKAMAKYRDLAVIALEARAAKAA